VGTDVVVLELTPGTETPGASVVVVEGGGFVVANLRLW
jgi:hypothetical protein